jgi:cytochrome b561
MDIHKSTALLVAALVPVRFALRLVSSVPVLGTRFSLLVSAMFNLRASHVTLW